MKDNVAVGVIAGVIGGSIGIAFSYTMFLLGISAMSSIHLAASLVVIDVLNLTTLGFISAIAAHLTVATAFGVVMTFILLYTGKDFWLLKGLGFGALWCLISHSYFIPLMRTDEQVRTLIFNAPSWATMVTTHSLIGLVTAAVIVKYHYLLAEHHQDAETGNTTKTKSYHVAPTPASKKIFKDRKIRLVRPKKL